MPDEIKSYGCVAKWLTGRDKTEKRFVVAKSGTELELYLVLDPIMTGENPTPSYEEKAAWDVLKSLAATRELLEKHRYNRGGYCAECGTHRGSSCPSDCAIATALRGVGGE